MSHAVTFVSGAAGQASAEALGAHSLRMMRLGLGAIAVWVGAFALWATAAPISGGIVAQGLVRVDALRRTVTHRDGGTVAAIRVREGQRVQRGEVLIELADVRVDAAVELLRAQLSADRLRHARLEAEALGAGSWQPPTALLDELGRDARVLEQARKEVRSFSARRDNVVAQSQGEQAQAQHARAEIEARLRERENARKAVELMQDELKLNQRLEQEQFVNRTRVMTLQRAVSEYESRTHANEAELAQARQRLGTAELRMRSLHDGLMQSAAEELREVAQRIADNQQRLRSSQDEQSRQKVVAPEAGTLVNLRVNTPGSALGAREPIVDIVPSGTPLQVEARLPVDVAAEVHAGTRAELKLMSLAARYQPLLAARVTQVSADALTDERSGMPYLRAQLQVDPEALAGLQEPIQPGMAAEVYIKTAERSPLGFLLDPVSAYFRRAFRER